MFCNTKLRNIPMFFSFFLATTWQSCCYFIVFWHLCWIGLRRRWLGIYPRLGSCRLASSPPWRAFFSRRPWHHRRRIPKHGRCPIGSDRTRRGFLAWITSTIQWRYIVVDDRRGGGRTRRRHLADVWHQRRRVVF